MCKDEIRNLDERLDIFITNDFKHLNTKVDVIREKVDSRTATYAFITAIITLITVIVK
ncbi:hypothetical protein KAR91_64220 [Candidatus Pacearchaeota archaeon]|nr:hypothetical protein [Candidatus Pacearchaeota archaeon]